MDQGTKTVPVYSGGDTWQAHLKPAEPVSGGFSAPMAAPAMSQSGGGAAPTIIQPEANQMTRASEEVRKKKKKFGKVPQRGGGKR